MKHLIITGPQASGKTAELKKVLAKYNDDEVLTYTITNFITYRILGKNHLLILEATENTKCIVIKEVTNHFKSIDFAVNTKVYLKNKISGAIEEIKPLFVFISKVPVPQLSNQLLREFKQHFKVITVKNQLIT